MVDELLQSVVPRGACLAAGLVLGVLFSHELRPVAKRAIKWGMAAGGTVQEVAAEAFERGQDLFAEARYEREQELHEAEERRNGARPATPDAASGSGSRGSAGRGRRAAGA